METYITYIISAFPGCGKTYATRMFGDKVKIMDSDSSTFDKSGFPENYVKHIEDCIGKCDILFVSSHYEVRELLDKLKLQYTLFYPSVERRDEFLTNYVARRSSPELIKKIDHNFMTWIDNIDNEESEYCQRIKLSSFGQFIGNEQHFRDLIDEIVQSKEARQQAD